MGFRLVGARLLARLFPRAQPMCPRAVHHHIRVQCRGHTHGIRPKLRSARRVHSKLQLGRPWQIKGQRELKVSFAAPEILPEQLHPPVHRAPTVGGNVQHRHQRRRGWVARQAKRHPITPRRETLVGTEDQVPLFARSRERCCLLLRSSGVRLHDADQALKRLGLVLGRDVCHAGEWTPNARPRPLFQCTRKRGIFPRRHLVNPERHPLVPLDDHSEVSRTSIQVLNNEGVKPFALHERLREGACRLPQQTIEAR